MMSIASIIANEISYDQALTFWQREFDDLHLSNESAPEHIIQHNKYGRCATLHQFFFRKDKRHRWRVGDGDHCSTETS
jgi:hypothetical protein